MQLWKWLIRNHLLLDIQNAIWLKSHSIPGINTLWNALWFKLALKLQADWFICDVPVVCLFCSHGLWNRSSMITEHLQIMFFSIMEMGVSFFILFSLVELWSLMPEMYFLSKIYLFYWLSIYDEKETSRIQNKLSTLYFIFMMKCRLPIKRQILLLKKLNKNST